MPKRLCTDDGSNPPVGSVGPCAELLLRVLGLEGVGSILVHEKVIQEVIKDKGYHLVNVRGTSGGSRLDLPTRLCGTWACATTVRRQEREIIFIGTLNLCSQQCF